jgi:hypothetical protein
VAILESEFSERTNRELAEMEDLVGGTSDDEPYSPERPREPITMSVAPHASPRRGSRLPPIPNRKG